MEYLDNDYEIMYYIKENDSEIPLELMIEKYTKLVEYLANEVHKKIPFYIDIDDLRQEGMIALIDAINKYTYKYDNKISTYFYSCIKFKMSNYVRTELSLKRKLNNTSISIYDSFNEEGVNIINKISDGKVDLSSIIENKEQYFFIHSKLNNDESILFDLKINNFPKEEIMQLLELNLKSYNNKLYYLRKKLLCNFNES